MTDKAKISDVDIVKMTQNVLDKTAFLCERIQDGIPYTLQDNGEYNNMDYEDENPDLGINWWTNGFFAGILWQMYQATGDSRYREQARVQEKKLDRCFEIFEGIHHDAGFMWLLSAAADYRLTGDKTARQRALHAATILAGRFNLNGSYIRAWNGQGGREYGIAIIDSLMNMSLLHWAYEETGDPRFEAIALSHTDTVLKYFVREDGSVKHIVKFDPETGEKTESLGGQGMAHGSAWSRGQAWAIYGFANAYRHTRKEEYGQAAFRVSDYFLNHLREGAVPVDFDQPMEETCEDNSAASIAASGLLELSELAVEIGGQSQAQRYRQGALLLIRRIYEQRLCLDHSREALVMQCAVSYAERNRGSGTLIYADYFYLEAMLKLRHNALMIW